jgi:hypothetical protein
MTLQLTTEVTAELESLWDTSLAALSKLRGGHTLVSELGGAPSLGEHVALGECYVEVRDGSVVGFAVMSQRIIQGVFVVATERRRGIARSMVSALLALDDPPLDAWALPGDRATKSLYESIGWKARLLTMRGD